MRSDRGLTLIELIVVLIIIMTLAGILLPVVWQARMAGLKTECKSNLQQISKAIIMYRDDYMYRGKELNPPWLRTLLPVKTPVYKQGYLGKKEILLCPMDSSYGANGGKPDDASDQYAELDEGSSYMYEFNMAQDCSWDYASRLTLPGNPADVDKFIDLDGNQTSSKWGEVKTAQMRYGDTALNSNGSVPLPESQWHGYSPTRFPILRCFWHASDPDTGQPDIINMAYQGNIFLSGADWEETSMH